MATMDLEKLITEFEIFKSNSDVELWLSSKNLLFAEVSKIIDEGNTYILNRVEEKYKSRLSKMNVADDSEISCALTYNISLTGNDTWSKIGIGTGAGAAAALLFGGPIGWAALGGAAIGLGVGRNKEMNQLKQLLISNSRKAAKTYAEHFAKVTSDNSNTESVSHGTPLISGGVDCSELIKDGNCFFDNGQYGEAFACFKKGMDVGNAFCSFMLGECYRIAYHQQNLSELSDNSGKDYAWNAIKLYSKAYHIEKNPIYLLRNYCFKYIFFRPRKESYYYKETMQCLSATLNNPPDVSNDSSARFLLAVKADSFLPLFDFIKDETNENYLRIAACIEIYKQYVEEEYTCPDDENSAKEALIIANGLGAHFDIDSLFCDCEEVESDDYEYEDVEYEDDDDDSEDVYEPYCVYESTYPESDNGGYNYGWGGEDGITSDDGPDDLYDYFYNDDYDGWDYDDY